MVTQLRLSGSRGDRERAGHYVADTLGAVRTVPSTQAAGLHDAACLVLDELSWDAAAGARADGVVVAVETWPESARVTIEDRAAPMTADAALAASWLSTAARSVDVAHAVDAGDERVRYALTSWRPLPPEVAATESGDAIGTAIDIRPFRNGDQTPIAALLRTAFGPIAPLRSSSYYPERLLERVRSGELRPHVAVADRRVIGHVGLHRERGPAGWRTGTTAVAPAARGRHLANGLKEASLATLPGDATDVFALTIGVHRRVQAVHLRLGLRETAIELDAVAETRSAGYGIPQARWSRQSHVRFHRPLQPRRRAPRLPEAYAALLGDAYDRLGVEAGDAGTTRTGPERAPARREDAIRLEHDPADATATLTIDAVPRDWRERCRRLVRAAHELPVGMVFARVALNGADPMDPVIALLNAHGFFYAGLRLGDDPHDRDFLGLQARAIPAQGEHRLELASDFARSLHDAILADESRIR